MDRNASPAALWQLHARRTVRRLNLAWWLQFFAPWAAGLGLVLMGVVLWLRSQGRELPWPAMLGSLVGVYLVTGLICWAVARRRFAKTEEGMVLLESRLKLNNALSAAAGGVTAWPPVPEKVDDGFRFRAPWLMAPAILTVTCLSLAFLLPISQAVAPPSLPPPLALTRAENILNTLEKEEVADPEALEKAREQLQALLNQPPEDYYTHHSLEAADALETSLGEAAGNLGQQLQTAAQAAESLEKYDSSLSPSAKQQLETDLKSAIEGIKNSSFGASEALQKQLGQLDPSKLKELDPAQMKKMMENLKAKSAACKNCKGGACEGQSEAEKALSELLNGKKKGQGEGEGKEGPGQGGVDRGPGTEEISYSNNPNDLSTNKLEQLESQDLSRTLPGDHLGTRDVEHQLDKSATAPTAGGSVSTPAGGGDAVWRDQLLPSEQKVLRKYFK
jgi:hypothetical protein